MTDLEPSVAVVIPTYNHARFLEDAIVSVLGQTVRPAQVLVVDDGSVDRPEEVVAKHPEVELIRQPNRGLAAARNAGLHQTWPALIMFLDADDELRPRAIESSLRCLSDAPRAAFSYGAYANKWMPSGAISEAEFRPVPKSAFADFLRVNPIGMHGTVMYRRQALTAAGGFCEALPACEDYELYLRLGMDQEVACTPSVLADYRQHDANMSADPAFMLAAVLRVLRGFRRAAADRGLLRDYRAGVEAAKVHYVSLWGQRVKRDGLDLVSLRQGGVLIRLAPLEMLRRTCSAATVRIRRPRRAR